MESQHKRKRRFVHGASSAAAESMCTRTVTVRRGCSTFKNGGEKSFTTPEQVRRASNLKRDKTQMSPRLPDAEHTLLGPSHLPRQPLRTLRYIAPLRADKLLTFSPTRRCNVPAMPQFLQQDPLNSASVHISVECRTTARRQPAPCLLRCRGYSFQATRQPPQTCSMSCSVGPWTMRPAQTHAI